MDVTAFTYPWDLARLGPTSVVDEMSGLGIAAIDLASTYHPIDSLAPPPPLYRAAWPAG